MKLTFNEFISSIWYHVTLAIRANGTNIPFTVISRTLSIGTSSVYSGSVLIQLPTSTTNDMTIFSLKLE